MKNTIAIAFALALLVCRVGWAAEEGKLPDLAPAAVAGSSSVAEQRAAKDAACTRCHDESEAAPVLSIYQTKHGVKGDARTPTCQACHGESEKHLKGDPAVKGRAAPDVVFRKGAYAASDEKVSAPGSV